MVSLPDVQIIDEIIRKVDKLPQMQCPVSNYFAPGIYVREMFIPAGTVAVGHKHLTEHICSIIHGKIAFLKMDHGVDYYEAPATFLAATGRKIVYAISDTIVQNVHPNPDNITDMPQLEKLFIDKSGVFEEIEDKSIRALDIIDFHKIEYKMPDCEYLPMGNVFKISLAVNHSNIHGRGFFATWPYKKHEYICPWMIGGKYTEAARWVNHAKNPNACVHKFQKGEMALFAAKNIKGCVGGSPGEEITLNYRRLKL